MSSKKGLGIKDTSSHLLSPCPSMIDKYFKDQLRYWQNSAVSNSPYIVKYVKNLNNGDNPVFPSLKNINCASYIIVDLYTGRIVDHYLKINRGAPIRKFADCPDTEDFIWILKYHFNIVHLSREYIKGGWMQRKAIKKEFEETKDKYVILNKKGFSNILEKAKPDNIEFLGNGRMK